MNVVAAAEQNNLKASFILDQVSNYNKKDQHGQNKLRYCVIFRNLSTKAYEYIRSEQLLDISCRNTLQKFIGTPVGEIGFSPLVCCRLKTELESWTSAQS